MNETAVPAPGWATFFHGWVPGLWHFRAGDRRAALLAFVPCVVLFAAGFAIVQDRIFYYAMTPEGGTGWFSTAIFWLARLGFPTCLPELLNWPCTAVGALLTFDGSYEGYRLWRMPRDLEHLGGWLSGASGMLAAFWAADAQFRASVHQAGRKAQGAVAPAMAAGLSWILPGLGHVRAGQKDKGVLMGLAVLLVFAAGLVASEGHAVDRPLMPVWWIGQNLCGLGSLFAALVTAPLPMASTVAGLDLGIVLCTVAGLMNLVVMVDAYTVAERAAVPEVDAVPAGEGGVA